MSRVTTLPIQAGQLRRRFTIQERLEVQDAYGQPRVEWRTFRIVHGALVPLRGDERFRAEQIEAHVTHRIVTRYVAGVTSKMRILDDRDRTFDVKAVYDPDDRRRGLVWDVEGEGV